MVSEDFFSEDGPPDVFNFIGLVVWGDFWALGWTDDCLSVDIFKDDVSTVFKGGEKELLP